MASKYGGIPVDNNGSKYGGIPVDLPTVKREVLQPISGYPGRQYVDPMLNMATKPIAQVAGGLAGLVSLPYGIDEAVENMQSVSNAMTYEPSTAEGRQNLESVNRYAGNVTQSLLNTLPGEGIQAVGEGYNRLADAVGERSPALGAGMKTLPVAASMAPGLGFLQQVRPKVRMIENDLPTPQLEALTNKQGFAIQNATDETKALVPVEVNPGLIQSAQSKAKKIGQEMQAQQIQSGGRDAGLAPFRIENGRKVNDKFAKAAINNGWDAGTVQMMKTANPQTRAYMNEMLEKRWIIKNDKTGSRTNLPMTVVGKSMNERIKFLHSEVKKENANLNRIKRTKLDGVPVNGAPVEDAFYNLIDKWKIGVITDSKGFPFLDFSESVFKVSREGQQALRNIVKLMTTKKTKPDAADYHLLKEQLDDLIDYSKSPKSGMTAKAQESLNTVRREVNNVIRKAVPEYADANDKVSSILRVMDEFNEAAKVKFHLLDDTNASLGQEMRVLQTNYARGPLLDQAAAKVDQLANELGGNFKSSYSDLVTFANDLDARFGSSKTGDFQGKNQAAIRAERFAEDAAIGNKPGMIRQGLGAVGDGINKMRGKDPDFDAYQSLKILLSR